MLYDITQNDMFKLLLKHFPNPTLTVIFARDLI